MTTRVKIIVEPAPGYVVDIETMEGARSGYTKTSTTTLKTGEEFEGYIHSSRWFNVVERHESRLGE